MRLYIWQIPVSYTHLDVYKRQLQQLGDMLYSDYNENNPLYRVQAISRYVKWLQQYGANFEDVAVYSGNSYAIPYVNTIVDIPVEKSSHIVLDLSLIHI